MDVSPEPDRGSRMSNSASDIAEQGLEFHLTGGPHAGAEARRAIVAANGFLPTSVRADLLLLVTELVSNAVRHSGAGPEQSVRVLLRLRRELIRVEVIDPGRSFTRADARPAPHETGGWGLFLVDRLATRWGVTRRAAGTSVWFEIAAQR
jgi:anti-sigma regulatory factor (Ser/Thr protein kinase)